MEQFLPPWGVCNLGHIVLSRFYNPLTNEVDWNKLKRAVRAGVRFQDNMIDYTDYFMEENREQQLGERRVGLGTMGLATLLIKMGKKYGAEETMPFIDKLFKFIAVSAYEMSIEIAEEKGKFPFCEPEKMAQSGFMKRMLPELSKEYKDKFFNTGIRNVTIITQAPTGSTGTAIDNLLQQYGDGTSTGIEPYFAFSYWRASRSGQAVEQKVPLIEDIAKKLGKPIEEIDFLVTAQELTPKEHIYVQSAIQKWVDSSISKTANCPSTFTVEDAIELYQLAYEMGCKGVTIYRANSREAQVLSVDKESAKLETDIEQEELARIKKQAEISTGGFVGSFGTNALNGKETVLSSKDAELIKGLLKPNNSIQKRSSDLPAIVRKIKYQYGDTMTKAYVTVCWDEKGNPVEVFIMPSEEAEMPNAFALGRMITQFLRFGSTSDNVEQALKHLKKGQNMLSLPSQVARLISDIQYKKIEIGGIKKEKKEKPQLGKCKSCGENMYDKANCICYSCGTSSCN